MHETILTLAKAMVSPGTEELPLLEQLCLISAEELTRKLRQEVTAAECPPFCCAAAMLAASYFLICGETGTVEQFTAGEISVRSGSSAEAAAALRQQAHTLMEPYCGDENFAFLGVQG